MQERDGATQVLASAGYLSLWGGKQRSEYYVFLLLINQGDCAFREEEAEPVLCSCHIALGRKLAQR